MNKWPWTKMNRKLVKGRIYCICQTEYDENKFYLKCDECKKFLHMSCLDVTLDGLDEITKYNEWRNREIISHIPYDCPICEAEIDRLGLKKMEEKIKGNIMKEERLCICQRLTKLIEYSQDSQKSEDRIGCDVCLRLHHYSCVGISGWEEADKIPCYICPVCDPDTDIYSAYLKASTSKPTNAQAAKRRRVGDPTRKRRTSSDPTTRRSSSRLKPTPIEDDSWSLNLQTSQQIQESEQTAASDPTRKRKRRTDYKEEEKEKQIVEDEPSESADEESELDDAELWQILDSQSSPPSDVMGATEAAPTNEQDLTCIQIDYKEEIAQGVTEASPRDYPWSSSLLDDGRTVPILRLCRKPSGSDSDDSLLPLNEYPRMKKDFLAARKFSKVETCKSY